MTSLTRTVFAFVTIAAVGSAHAKPPPGADLTTPTAQWFKAQHSMDGSWCCDIADGHLLDDEDWRMKNSTYEVRINGEWITIPEKAKRDPNGGPNPTGHAVVWYTIEGTSTGRPFIFCFAPGTEF